MTRDARNVVFAEKIDAIALARHVSRDRAIADHLKDATASYEQRKAAFLELGDRLLQSTDPAETEQLREQLLARTTFGD